MRAVRLLTVLALTAVAGCGSMLRVDLSEQEREVGEFDRIWVMGDVLVRVELGRNYGAAVVAHEDYLGAVATQVSDSALIISRKSASPTPGGLEVRVRVPYLAAVSLQGGAELHVDGLSGPDFEVQVQGSGRVRGSGNVELVLIEVLGSGRVDLARVTCRDARVRLSGSGQVDVTPSRKLDAVVEGGGRVTFAETEGLEFRVRGEVEAR